MSEHRPDTAPRRPATARPRRGGEHDARPPDRHELEAIERQLAELPRSAGATLTERPELGALLVHQSGRGPGLNFAACIRWSSESVPRLMRALEDEMRRSGEWPALVVADGLTQPADLPLWLETNGWVTMDQERVMWTRHPPPVPHLDPALRVEAVTRRTAADFERVEREVFGLAHGRATERAESLASAVDDGQFRGFLVRLGGTVVATARLAPGEGVAGIFGVGVAADYRRRGYGPLITAIATRAGLASGSRLVWLSVDEGNQPAVSVYRRLGYRSSFSWTRWIGAASRQISR